MEEQCGDVSRLLTFLFYRIGNVFTCPNLVISDEMLNLTKVAYPMLLVQINALISSSCTRFILRLFKQIPIGHPIVNIAVPFHLVNLAFSIAGPFEQIAY